MAVEVSPASGHDQAYYGRMPKARKSRVTNGADLLPNIDGRSVTARRYKDIASAILTDQGGIDRCSESRQQLIRRFAAAAVLAERLEGRLANGEDIDIEEHAKLSSTLVKLAQRIGLDRVAKDVGSNLGDFMRLAAMTPATGTADASERVAPVTIDAPSEPAEAVTVPSEDDGL
jgi:hypothetical protein